MAANNDRARVCFTNLWCSVHLSVRFIFCPLTSNVGNRRVITRLNVSTKSLALVGAVLLLLDFASTAVVSAATAASYLAGEVALPFPTFVGSIFVFVIFTFISLAGIRTSTRVALATLIFHVRSLVGVPQPC
jgi:hypothetical protein